MRKPSSGLPLTMVNRGDHRQDANNRLAPARCRNLGARDRAPGRRGSAPSPARRGGSVAGQIYLHGSCTDSREVMAVSGRFVLRFHARWPPVTPESKIIRAGGCVCGNFPPGRMHSVIGSIRTVNGASSITLALPRGCAGLGAGNWSKRPALPDQFPVPPCARASCGRTKPGSPRQEARKPAARPLSPLLASLARNGGA
jgi:hypothetical protein